MTDERIDILTPQGHFTGKTAMKSEAHRMGWFHHSIHVWFYTSKKEILLQKRTAAKETFPNLWDTSVAGHVAAGEMPITSAVREIHEEIGISVHPDALQFIGIHRAIKTPTPLLFDNEFHHIYCCQLSQDINTLILQKEEVAAVKLIQITDFESDIKTVSRLLNYVPHGLPYYNLILKTIRGINDDMR